MHQILHTCICMVSLMNMVIFFNVQEGLTGTVNILSTCIWLCGNKCLLNPGGGGGGGGGGGARQ